MSPVTMLVARRVPRESLPQFRAWLHEGQQLAADFPGYLGSGVLAAPPGDDQQQIIFRFSDAATLASWEHSASRRAWLQRGAGLFAHPHEHRVHGSTPGSAMPCANRLAGSRASPSGWPSFRSRWSSTCYSVAGWPTCPWCCASWRVRWP